MVRPLRDYVLIAVERVRTQVGVIHRVGEPPIRTAVVLRRGPGRWQGKRYVPTTVQPGDRVALPTQHTRHQSGKTLTWHLNEVLDAHSMLEGVAAHGYDPGNFEIIALVREVDLLGVVAADVAQVELETGAWAL